jgi:hypothetical protein
MGHDVIRDLPVADDVIRGLPVADDVICYACYWLLD